MRLLCLRQTDRRTTYPLGVPKSMPPSGGHAAEGLGSGGGGHCAPGEAEKVDALFWVFFHLAEEDSED